MNPVKTQLLVAASVFSALGAITTQADPIISVDLLNASGQAITGTFGISSLGTDVGGWNNPIKLYSAANLSYSDASSSTVGFSLTTPSGAYATYNAAYAGTPLAGGPDAYATPTTLTLNNLNANFANGYWIVAYIGGFNANNGASISDGTDTYYYQSLNPPTAPVTFIQTTQTTDLGAGNETVAQYAVFGSSSSLLTSDSLTLTLSTVAGGAGGSAIGGFQIIGAPSSVPEPSTMAVALLGGAGLLVLARRKKWNRQ